MTSKYTNPGNKLQNVPLSLWYDIKHDLWLHGKIIHLVNNKPTEARETKQIILVP